MKITLNGQPKEFAAETSLQNIVEQFCRNSTRIIAEVNGNIIRSPLWKSTSIREGDTIELVSFVGGG